MAKYLTCPECNANLNHGEKCDCQKIDIDPERIPRIELKSTARVVLSAMAKVIDRKTGKFKDPEIAADYERWLAERQNKEAALEL